MRPGERNRERPAERGSTFVLVTFLVITSAALIGAYLSTSLGKVRHVELQAARTGAFHAAEAGLNAAMEEIWNQYRNASPVNRMEIVADLDGRLDPDTRFTEDLEIADFDVQVEVRSANLVDREYVDVELISVARGRGASRTIRAVVRFDLEQSRVFDHAYFINNFGWLWGKSIEVNGDVRSNGNFSLSGPLVNGDTYAARNGEIEALGTIEGTSDHEDWLKYNNNGIRSRQARPSNPSAEPEDKNGNGVLDPGEDRNGNGLLDSFDYAGGYPGTVERFPEQQVLEMPYLGDLEIYRNLARSAGGTLSQGGATLVQAVSGDLPGEPRNQVLIGTKDNPIVIDGPVVVEGDVVIKGYITGRGSIYAGRNIHILGDLTYANPPEWKKPVEDQEAVKTVNQTKDQVGLVAKGSVVMGDYTDGTWQSNVGPYSRPPFTHSYVVDPTDDANGYVTSWNADGQPVFHGNYTERDGGKKDATPPGGDPVDPDAAKARRYYESSFPDEYIRKIAEKKTVQNVDAVIYTNHLLTGLIGPTVFNGALISRDEAIVYYKDIVMNHDTRVRGNGYEFMDIWLPRQPSYRILFWSEETP